MKTLLLIALLFALPGHAETIVGKVVGVADGDTLTLRVEGQPQIRVRLSAIDAPEKRQAFGERSKQTLSDVCFGRPARIEVVDTDRYGRKVAEVWCNEIYVNILMVRRGFAWVYRRYAGLRPDLYAAEVEARLASRGLWAEPSPTPPWEYRHPR